MKKPNLLIIIITGLSILSCSSEDLGAENEISDGNNEKYQKLLTITSTKTDSEEIKSTTELTYDNDNLFIVKEIYHEIGENIWNYSYSKNNDLEMINNLPVQQNNEILITEYIYERYEYVIENAKVISVLNYFRDENNEPFIFNYKENLSYLDNNIIEVTIFDSNDNLLGFTTYEYDNKNNLLKGLRDINRWTFPVGKVFGISNNNVINRMEFDQDGNLLAEFDYEYKYDNNDFPITRKTNYTDGGITSTSTDFFSYE